MDDLRRSAAGIAVLVVLAGVIVTATAMAHFDATRSERVIIADDPDPAADEFPPFIRIGPQVQRNATDTDRPSLAEAARMRDFYYDTTSPAFRFGPENRTLRSYRRARLAAIEYNHSTSRWPAHAPEPQDGPIIKDAYIAFMGTDGARLTINRSDAVPAPHYIPRNGSVYSLLDYRVAAPTPSCRETDAQTRCVTYEVLNATTVRNLTIGNQTWRARGREPARTINYSGVRAVNTTTLRVSATINVTARKVTRVYEGERQPGSTPVRTNRPRVTRNLTVSDERRAVVTTNQQMSVRQRVINTTDGRRIVVLTFDGPRSLTARRLWSRAQVGNTTLRNIWGSFSRRRYTNATLATANGSRPYELPHVLAVNVTSRFATPTLRYAPRGDDRVSFPEVARTQGYQVTDRAPRLGARVNLSTAPVRVLESIVIEGTPQRATGVEDIHGDPIPVTTRTYQQRPATLDITRVNESHARVTLRDATTGRPLAGRRLALRHAVRDTAVTDDAGTVVVERDGVHVSVSFQGTNWTAQQDRYYGPARAGVTFPTPFSLYQAIASIAGAFVSVIGFVLLYLPFWYVFRR